MPHADIKLWELCCPLDDVVLHPDAHPGGLGHPRCRCPRCSARFCCPPAAAAAKPRGRGASPSPARACVWPPPACPAAPRCATSPDSSAPSHPPSPPRPQGWPPPPSSGTMNLLQKYEGRLLLIGAVEQRIVSTGEKFYSKYLFESQIMMYIQVFHLLLYWLLLLSKIPSGIGQNNFLVTKIFPFIRPKFDLFLNYQLKTIYRRVKRVRLNLDECKRNILSQKT